MKPRRVKGNPVSYAVAANNLRSAILSQKLRIYTQEQGEECEELMVGIAMTLNLICYAAELDPKVKKDDVELRIARGGLSACEQMAKANSWDGLQARAITEALDNAEILNRRIETKYVLKALSRLTLGA
jgi:hypothetical protein